MSKRPARKAKCLHLQHSRIPVARSYEFAKRLTSSWLKPDPADIIVWRHRILEAYYSPKFDNKPGGQQTVSLVRHGPYEVRLVELSRKMQTGTK
jgi:hypothetical protein